MSASATFEAPPSHVAKRGRRHASTGATLPVAFADHYRCPEGLVEFGPVRDLSSERGFFRFGETLCYGRLERRAPEPDSSAVLWDSIQQSRYDGRQVYLPFDFSEIIANLQLERYAQAPSGYLQQMVASAVSKRLYQLVRPMLPIGIRKHVQRIGLRDWNRIAFPQWPVDITVEQLMEGAVSLALKESGLRRLPFIWFWPDGASACAIMTHDVEEQAGREFCDQLMDLDESRGIRSAFQLVPESRYEVTSGFVDRLRTRGFEVNVHDLDHDGRLFRNHSSFLERAPLINKHAARFGSRGFRAGAMYRRQEWFEALDISYDMSVPNVAHLEPQRGGCCTVTPYFVGRILELPLTTIQDYSLFHILGEYSISLWQTQAELILAKHGLISFITHPDYLIETRARRVYLELLSYLGQLRDERNVWVALPGEVDHWWRTRNRLQLVADGEGWRIHGPESEKARVAYARLDGDRLIYDIDRSGVGQGR
jgi:hypothetical protein